MKPSLVSTPHDLWAATNLQMSPRILGHQVMSIICRRAFSHDPGRDPGSRIEVLYGFLYQGLWDDELYLIAVTVLLDPPTQQSVLVLNVDPVGQWCRKRDGKSLQSVIITLQYFPTFPGQVNVGKYVGKIWPSLSDGIGFSIG